MNQAEANPASESGATAFIDSVGRRRQAEPREHDRAEILIFFPHDHVDIIGARTETPALAFADDVPDVLGILCWAIRDQLLAISNSELDEVADDKVAMDQKQRDIALAQINEDRLAAERGKFRLIWAAEARNNEILDFRPDTTPCVAIGVALKTVPRAALSPSSPEHACESFNRVAGGGEHDRAAGGLAACFLTGMHGRWTVCRAPPSRAISITDRAAGSLMLPGGASGRHTSLAQGVPPDPA